MNLKDAKTLDKRRCKRLLTHQISDLRVKEVCTHRLAKGRKCPGADDGRVGFMQRHPACQGAKWWRCRVSEGLPGIRCVNACPNRRSRQVPKPQNGFLADPFMADKLYPALGRNFRLIHPRHDLDA